VVEILIPILACVVMLVTELLHARRVSRLAPLAFGPGKRPTALAFAAPVLRTVSVIAIAWGVTALFLLQPKVHKLGEIPERDFRHLVLVLDVSPSMRLEDSGPTAKQARRVRAAELLRSFFERSPIELYKLTVVATYTEAKPVVVDTTDMEIVRNILDQLPMEFAFKPGPTNLFAGLEVAATIARPWRPRSTLVMVMSDGDTIPPTGMPKMPDSVSSVLVVGVGDPVTGKFIGGHQSRQDASSLRQMATRLSGNYHNGNEKHISTDLIQTLTELPSQNFFEKLTKREYALIAIATGSILLGLLPILLHWLGTRWRPGVRVVLQS
jgi:Ca-activated chloride channel family protein